MIGSRRRFINAIRGKEKITHTNEDGVRYMEFIAVTRSAQAGEKIHLPFRIHMIFNYEQLTAKSLPPDINMPSGLAADVKYVFSVT